MIDAEERAIEYATDAYGNIDCDKIGPFKYGYCKGVSDIKDALIELLKTSREDLYNWHFHKEQECWKTYDEIIDKLNSL